MHEQKPIRALDDRPSDETSFHENVYSDRDSVSVSLNDIIRVIWGGKWAISITVVVSVAVAVLYLLSVPSRYDVSMTIAPVAEAPSDVFGQLEAYGGLPGLNLGSRKPSSFETYFAAIPSVELARRFERDGEVYRELFASRWNEEGGTWEAPRKGVAAFFFELLGHPRNLRVPGERDLAAFLKENVKVSASDEAGMREVRFRYEDPEFATRLLRMIHGKIEQMLREDALQRTQAYIDYVKQALAQETVNDYRLALLQVLTEQQKRQMAIKVDQPFAARIFDPPSASRQPTSPNIPLTLAFSIFFGALVGGALIVVRSHVRRSSGRGAQ